jgi:hypothetical protein
MEPSAKGWPLPGTPALYAWIVVGLATMTLSTRGATYVFSRSVSFDPCREFWMCSDQLSGSSKVMGHTDVKTAMRYQHPILDPVRDAIDQQNLRHDPRHSEVRVL